LRAGKSLHTIGTSQTTNVSINTVDEGFIILGWLDVCVWLSAT